MWEPLFIYATVEASNFKFGIQVGLRGVAYQETTYTTKIGRGPGLGSTQKIWDPLFISATVEASNFKFGIQLGLGSSLPKNNFYDQYWLAYGLGEYPKNLGSPTSSAIVEASNFKIGTQLRFGEYVTIATLVPNLVGAGCATGAPQNCGYHVLRTTYPVPRTLYHVTAT